MRSIVSSVAIVLACSAIATAQDARPALLPIKVQVVISRYQGEKKVSSLPYTLSVTANDRSSPGQPIARARLKTGAQVPVATLAMPSMPPDAPKGAMGPVTYKEIGTQVDCGAISLDDGRFKLDIAIEDTSVYAEDQTAPNAPKLSGIPTFRSFTSSESLILRDGQTAQFTAATDKINGEVTRVDVTLTVVK